MKNTNIEGMRRKQTGKCATIKEKKIQCFKKDRK
jgi:hypothetical protein